MRNHESASEFVRYAIKIFVILLISYWGWYWWSITPSEEIGEEIASLVWATIPFMFAAGALWYVVKKDFFQ